MVDEDPTISTRKISNQVNACTSKVWRTLHKSQLYPYHVQRVQALIPRDYPLRVQFCEWLLQQNGNDENFNSRILGMDETTFTPNGLMNFRNTYLYLGDRKSSRN
jgi:hypothetical protein